MRVMRKVWSRPTSSIVANCARLSAITPEASANVIVNLQKLVRGSGKWPISGTHGPDVVASTCT
jgi:hypothetical protein